MTRYIVLILVCQVPALVFLLPEDVQFMLGAMCLLLFFSALWFLALFALGAEVKRWWEEL